MPHMLGLFCEKNMPIQQISLGARPKGEGGDTWREGSEKINGNFQNLDERTTLAQNTANSKTANETDEFLLSRENHTGSQPMSAVTGLQDALDSVSDAVNNVNDAVIAVDVIAKAAIPSNQKGMANGVATLDSAGIIPANQLPSYVDDVLEFATLANFPSVGEAGKIYIAIETSKIYRWAGTVYVTIGGAEAADTALRLFTARTISISDGATGTATQFDGSANITIPITEIDATKITKGLIPSARIPTLNQSTTGNAATATKLATPRKINGVSFDGTGDINLNVYSKSEVDTAIASAAITPNATETTAGKAKVATTAIAQAGTNDTDFITPLKLQQKLTSTVFGEGQTWQNVKSIRFAGTTYTNDTDKTITIWIDIGYTGDGYFYFNDEVFCNYRQGSSEHTIICLPIPPAGRYKIQHNPAQWWEMR